MRCRFGASLLRLMQSTNFTRGASGRARMLAPSAWNVIGDLPQDRAHEQLSIAHVLRAPALDLRERDARQLQRRRLKKASEKRLVLPFPVLDRDDRIRTLEL